MPDRIPDDEDREHRRVVQREPREAIVARQERAWELRFVRGFSNAQVAEALGIGISQTKKDLASARRRRIEQMQADTSSQDDALLFRSVLRDRLEMTHRQVSLGLIGSRPGTNQHIGYTVAALKSVEAQIKAGTALGMLCKDDEESRHEIIAGLDPNRLSDEELRLLREMFAEVRRRAAGGREPAALPSAQPGTGATPDAMRDPPNAGH